MNDNKKAATVAQGAPSAKVETPKATTEEKTPLRVVEDKPQQLPKEERKPVTIQAIRDKMENQQKLFEKREYYARTKKELEGFRISAHEETAVLSFQDNAKHEFMTANPNFIQKVQGLIIEGCDDAIATIDKKLLELELN